MVEPALTVVLCRACRHSDRLTLTDGRFWCAWCQRWAEIDTVRVLDAQVVLHGDDFRLAPVAKSSDWLQPLRVPAGWQIVLNSLAEEDIDGSHVAYFGGRDLFFATNGDSRRAIDIEWRADRDQPAVGRYLLRVFPLIEATQEDQQRRPGVGQFVTDWDTVIHEFETSSRAALVAELEACLHGSRG